MSQDGAAGQEGVCEHQIEALFPQSTYCSLVVQQTLATCHLHWSKCNQTLHIDEQVCDSRWLEEHRLLQALKSSIQFSLGVRHLVELCLVALWALHQQAAFRHQHQDLVAPAGELLHQYLHAEPVAPIHRVNQHLPPLNGPQTEAAQPGHQPQCRKPHPAAHCLLCALQAGLFCRASGSCLLRGGFMCVWGSVCLNWAGS